MKRSFLCPVPAELARFPSAASEFCAGNADRGEGSFIVVEPVGGIVRNRGRHGRSRAVAAGCHFLWGPHG